MRVCHLHTLYTYCLGFGVPFSLLVDWIPNNQITQCTMKQSKAPFWVVRISFRPFFKVSFRLCCKQSAFRYFGISQVCVVRANVFCSQDLKCQGIFVDKYILPTSRKEYCTKFIETPESF